MYASPDFTQDQPHRRRLRNSGGSKHTGRNRDIRQYVAMEREGGKHRRCINTGFHHCPAPMFVTGVRQKLGAPHSTGRSIRPIRHRCCLRPTRRASPRKSDSRAAGPCSHPAATGLFPQSRAAHEALHGDGSVSNSKDMQKTRNGKKRHRNSRFMTESYYFQTKSYSCAGPGSYICIISFAAQQPLLLW